MVANMIEIIATIGSVLGVGVLLGAFVHRVTSKLDEKLTGQIGALDGKLTGQIGALDDKLTARIDGKIDSLDEKLTGQIGALDAKFDAKIDKLGGDLRAEIRGVRTELTARIDAVHGELIDTRVHLSDRVSRLEGAVLGAAAPEPARESA